MAFIMPITVANTESQLPIGPEADMPQSALSSIPLRSVRPAVTAGLMEATGLDEELLTALFHRFYDRARADPLLGPVFDARIENWGRHLERMVAFWSSVALMTGRYHGSPVAKHAPLPIGWEHFERWLAIFRETARETCPPAGAAHLIERAERIARSLHIAAGDAARARQGVVPTLR
jgi:hemoglobin